MPTKAVRLTMPLVGEANAAGYLVMVPGASVLIRQNGVALVGSAGPGSAAVFSDNDKTPMTNPVPTGVTPGTAGVDTDGRLLVYLNPGSGYDVQATVGNATTTAPLPDVGVDAEDVADVADLSALEAEVGTKQDIIPVGTYLPIVGRLDIPKNHGALGGGADDTAAVVACATALNALGGGTVYLDDDYVCDLMEFTGLVDVEFSGPGSLKLKAGVTGGTILMFHACTRVAVHHTTIDGNKANVTAINRGFWDSPITFDGCIDSRVEHCLVKDTPSVGINVGGGSVGCTIAHNDITGHTGEGIQVHAGMIDRVTGNYTNGLPNRGTVVFDNTVRAGRGGIRSSGCWGTRITHNRILDLVSPVTAAAVYVYTSTADPMLEQGSLGTTVSDNWIDTQVRVGTPNGYIVVEQAGFSTPKPVVGVKVERNTIILRTSQVGIKFLGGDDPTYYMGSMGASGNVLDARNLTAGDETVGITASRNVTGVEIEDNSFLGAWSRYIELAAGNTNTAVNGASIRRNRSLPGATSTSAAIKVAGLSVAVPAKRIVIEDNDLTGSSAAEGVLYLNRVQQVTIQGNRLVSLAAGRSTIQLINHYVNIRIYENDFSESPSTTKVQSSSVEAGGSGSPILFRSNTGYITEASGSTAVSSGSTSKVVNHGMGRGPTKAIITPRATWGNITKWWVSTLGGTAITVNVDVAPATDWSFDWQASADIA